MNPNPLKFIAPLNSSVAYHIKKDIAMAELATQFIGKSAAPANTPSSTRNYQQAFGSFANTASYTSSDVVMISGSGPWRGVTMQQIQRMFDSHYLPLINKAIVAGASFVVGQAKGTDTLVIDSISR